MDQKVEKFIEVTLFENEQVRIYRFDHFGTWYSATNKTGKDQDLDVILLDAISNEPLPFSFRLPANESKPFASQEGFGATPYGFKQIFVYEAAKDIAAEDYTSKLNSNDIMPWALKDFESLPLHYNGAQYEADSFEEEVNELDTEVSEAAGKSDDGIPVQTEAGTLVELQRLAGPFDGMATSNTDIGSSDNNIAVGLTHIGQAVNSRVAFFDKESKQFLGSYSLNYFIPGYNRHTPPVAVDEEKEYIDPYTAETITPIISYDRFRDRWVVTFIAEKHGFIDQQLIIAISKTEDPLGQYYRYSVDKEDEEDIWSSPISAVDQDSLLITVANDTEDIDEDMERLDEGPADQFILAASLADLIEGTFKMVRIDIADPADPVNGGVLLASIAPMQFLGNEKKVEYSFLPKYIYTSMISFTPFDGDDNTMHFTILRFNIDYVNVGKTTTSYVCRYERTLQQPQMHDRMMPPASYRYIVNKIEPDAPSTNLIFSWSFLSDSNDSGNIMLTPVWVLIKCDLTVPDPSSAFTFAVGDYQVLPENGTDLTLETVRSCTIITSDAGHAVFAFSADYRDTQNKLVHALSYTGRDFDPMGDGMDDRIYTLFLNHSDNTEFPDTDYYSGLAVDVQDNFYIWGTLQHMPEHNAFWNTKIYCVAYTFN